MKNFKYILLIGVFIISNKLLYAQGYHWRTLSGSFEPKEFWGNTDNKVLAMTFLYDRKRTDAPVKYIEYRTIMPVSPSLQTSRISKSFVTFGLGNYFNKEKENSGEMAIFLHGDNFKELSYIVLHFFNSQVLSVELQKTSIIDPTKPMRAYGNYRTEVVYKKNLQMIVQLQNELRIYQDEKSVRVMLNNEKIIDYGNEREENWPYRKMNMLAYGFRGVVGWLDDVEIWGIYPFDGKKQEQLLLQDDFSVFYEKKKYILKKVN